MNEYYAIERLTRTGSGYEVVEDNLSFVEAQNILSEMKPGRPVRVNKVTVTDVTDQFKI